MSDYTDYEAWKEQGKPQCGLCHGKVLYDRPHKCLDGKLVKLPAPEWMEVL